MGGPGSLRVGSLFSGYEGLGMGLAHVLDAEPVWFSEIDKGASKILNHWWPDVPNHGDLTKIDWAAVEPVDVLTGGFPCQDLSHAGKRAGLKPGTRSGLWSHMAYAINQLRPSLVVAENVRGLLSAEAASDLEPCPWCLGDAERSPLRALGAVLGDLAELGYDAAWCGLRAADVGAPHGRFRVFVVAWPAADTSGVRRDTRWTAAPGQAGSGRPPADVAGRGLLPTPLARDWRGVGPADHLRHDPGLPSVVSLLPTPAVNDAAARIIAERSKVDEATGCHVWTGWTNGAYGKFSIGNKKFFAHRAAFALRHGEIPSGYEIDHLCQNPLCVNADHLEAVTPEENRRRVTERRTHCKRGHEFTAANTYWVRPGARACRACRAWQDLVQKARRKGEEPPLLPTPVTNDMGEGKTPQAWDEWTARMKAAHGNGNGHGASLAIEAQRLLPTPRAYEGGGNGPVEQERNSPGLQAVDYHVRNWGDYAAAIARWESLTRPAPAPTMTSTRGTTQLSPAFSEWLMGLPAGHVTAVPGLSRADQLKALGNGVVPAQAAAALEHLLALIPLRSAA